MHNDKYYGQQVFTYEQGAKLLSFDGLFSNPMLMGTHLKNDK